MCGGPVIDEAGVCIGALEGIVPLTFPDETLKNAAVYVESDDVINFLCQIECGEAESCAEQPREQEDALLELLKGKCCPDSTQ
jgi:hypothetical protein